MKILRKISVFALSILLSGSVFAQNSENDSIKTRPIQLTFISPLGTNGLEAGKVENNISLNMLAGYSAGLKGLELGGIANVTLGKATGGQFAGIANVVKADFIGGQFSGFSNAVWGNFTGVQYAGFANVTKGNLEIGQFSGFSNVTFGTTKGIQGAGFANIGIKKVSGLQWAGFSNVATEGIDGAQFSGFANVSTGNSKTIQVAGFANLATDTLEGVQVSGFVNIAQAVKGGQIGFINIADTVSVGAPVGFISIVRKGYHKLEIGSGESFYVNGSLKTGTRHFYNIFSTGFSLRNDNLVWAAGYGAGTEFPLKNDYHINFDLVNLMVGDSKAINSEEYWDFDNVTKLNITVSKQFFKHLSVYGGPTLNLSVSNRTDSSGNYSGSLAVPYSLYSSTGDYTKTDFYAGFRAGFRF